MRERVGVLVCLFAALALAAPLTVSCESDDDGDGGISRIGDNLDRLFRGDDVIAGDGDVVAPVDTTGGELCNNACVHLFGCIADNCPPFDREAQASPGEFAQLVGECTDDCEASWPESAAEASEIDCDVFWDAFVAEFPDIEQECLSDDFDDGSDDDFDDGFDDGSDDVF